MAKTEIILFDHVACGVPSVDAIGPLLEQGLGGRPHIRGPGIGFVGAQWCFAGEGKLELIEPDGQPGGFLHRFLDAGGPRVHHVTFKVPSIHRVRDRAEALGFRVVGFNDSFAGWMECFLHPKQVGGIVVQIVESDPDAEGGEWMPTPPPATSPSREPATFVGLKLLSSDADRLGRLWLDLLEGRSETPPEAEGDVVFHWKDCPLRIRVRVDPNAEEEGPLGLEFRDVGAAFPEGLRELLGAPLLSLPA